MNTELNTAARQFVGLYNGELVCHTAVLPLPMRSDAKRLHRSVVLPDYQGIGIGMNFKNAVCDFIRAEGWDGLIWSTTTTPAQYHAQCKSPKWKLIRWGRAKRNSGGKHESEIAQMYQSTSRQRITYSFVYVGAENKERLKHNKPK